MTKVQRTEQLKDRRAYRAALIEREAIVKAKLTKVEEEIATLTKGD